jgi:phosphoribosylamine--glycine ligase / phosphoribosylformylglycinamidine cyclo-ligase
VKKQDILIIGGGGREHAIAWKIAHSPKAGKIYLAPGNGGTALDSRLENIGVPATDTPALLEFAKTKKIALTIVGPDDPLALGVVDAFLAAGLRIFGPTQAAARLESSKAFAKVTMRTANVPTADFAVCTSPEDALEFVRDRPFVSEGFVIKADGLALGKGVLVCDTLEQAEAAILEMFGGAYGEAGKTVIIEERLSGREVSALCFCDGKTARMMPPARDHKRALNGDQGLNTGGMGAYAPVPDVSPALLEQIRQTVVLPILETMSAAGTPFVGVLYPGIMLTPDGIRVLEFNARFGDPETQVLLPLLETDLLEIVEACLDGKLKTLEPIWKKQTCATVVMASGGYPSAYETGKPITGLENVQDCLVFHAGTKQTKDEGRKQKLQHPPIPLNEGERAEGAGGVAPPQLQTNGGRVLAVSALGKTLETALKTAYTNLQKIHFDGAHYRTDIGKLLSTIGNLPSANSPSAYAQAGVNIAEGAKAVQLIKEAVKSTHDARVVAGVGAFGGVMDVSDLKKYKRPLLVASTDGVGTKTMVAAAVNDWSGIGADIVNHGINDILVQGAKPLFFMDYVAANTLKAEWVASVVSSMAEACREAGCVLLGGETAEMPGVYQKGESDVVGTMVGVLEHGKLIDGSRVQVGDCILGLPSSGLHTNGYSLARKTLGKLSWTKPRADLQDASIGEALLRPHRSYLPHIEALEQAGVEIRAMAHITGGGFWDNIPRTLPAHLAAAIKRGTWRIPPIFKLILERAGLSEHDAYHAFNMGIGMTVIVPEAALETALETLGDEVFLIGEVVARLGEGVVLT